MRPTQSIFFRDRSLFIARERGRGDFDCVTILIAFPTPLILVINVSLQDDIEKLAISVGLQDGVEKLSIAGGRQAGIEKMAITVGLQDDRKIGNKYVGLQDSIKNWQ